MLPASDPNSFSSIWRASRGGRKLSGSRPGWRLLSHPPDLGATITGPQADLNLGITTYVNGAPMNPVQLDTSTAATDAIAYVAADHGRMATST
jgi:hypothetical protein